MSKQQRAMERAYAQGKCGDWGQVLAMWQQSPHLAQVCSRYQKASSGWTFLHQAAYWGHETACRELIRLGAAVDKRSLQQKIAADIAEERGYLDLAILLRQAAQGEDSLWSPSNNAGLLPSSNLWQEVVERRALTEMSIAYGGGIVKIPAGARYFVDSFERTLVGWHGTYDPPCGMGGEPMV